MRNISLRNGDWSLKPVKASKLAKGEEHKGSYTFAEGEATNHFHTIVAERPSDFDIVKNEDGSYILAVKSPVKITHPEHSLKNDLTVTPGTYHLYRRREKDWFTLATRKVID